MRENSKSKSIVLVSLGLLVWLGITLGYSKWFSPTVVRSVGESLGLFFRSVVVPYGFAMPVAYLILRNVEAAPKGIGKECSAKCFAGLLIVQSGLSILPMILLNVIWMLVGFVGQENLLVAQEISISTVFLLLVFNPLAEEFLFRKLLLDRLMKYGAFYAIVISSVFFAIPHAFSQGIPQVVYTFVLGLVWAYARIKTQRLRVPILLHSLSNVWGMLLPSFLLRLELGPLIYLAVWVILVPILAILLLVKNRNRIRSEWTDGSFF